MHHVLKSAIIHTIWAIWIERNQRYFQDQHKPMSSLFNCILAEVKMSYCSNLAQGNSSMQDYNIPFQSKRVTVKQEVKWRPPPTGVFKFNCDGSTIGAHPCGAIGIVIRDSCCNFLGTISSNIGHASAPEAEFSACMLAIEKGRDLHMTQFCLETDSLQVVKAFKMNTGVPWKMRIRWFNCMKYCNSVSCSCVHVLREES